MKKKIDIVSAGLYFLYFSFFCLAILYILRERLSGSEKFFGLVLYVLIVIVVSVFIMGFYDEKE